MLIFVIFSKLRRTTTGGLGAHGAPWAPWGPTGAHGTPMGAHGRPMGAHGAPWAPSSPVVVRRNFEKLTKIGNFPIWGSKMGQKKVEIEGVGPP